MQQFLFERDAIAPVRVYHNDDARPVRIEAPSVAAQQPRKLSQQDAPCGVGGGVEVLGNVAKTLVLVHAPRVVGAVGAQYLRQYDVYGNAA